MLSSPVRRDKASGYGGIGKNCLQVGTFQVRIGKNDFYFMKMLAPKAGADDLGHSTFCTVHKVCHEIRIDWIKPNGELNCLQIH